MDGYVKTLYRSYLITHLKKSYRLFNVQRDSLKNDILYEGLRALCLMVVHKNVDTKGDFCSFKKTKITTVVNLELLELLCYQ